jgi:hypothetical protein
MSHWLRIAFALAVVVAAGAAPAQTYYSLVGGSGEQLQIGDDLFLPLRTGYSSVSPSMTMFPPLRIPLQKLPSKALAKQTPGPDPKRITLPPAVFNRPAPGARRVGVANRNPRIFQARTNIAFSAPAPAGGSAVLQAGGRTGAPIATFYGPPGTFIRYVKTAAQFGGPAQTQLLPATPIRLWLNPGAMLPCKHPTFGGANASCIAPLVALKPGTRAAIGAKVGFTTMTPGGPPPKSPNIVAISVPNTTGLIAKSLGVKKTGTITNAATSFGFPWTTGRITISASGALGSQERFTITGKDSRVSGAGRISLVSGALSVRKLTGTNASRGWLRLNLPEPAPAIGAGAALAALAICHGLARRHAIGGR